MGKLEQEHTKRAKKNQLKTALLRLAGVGEAVGIALVARGVADAMRKLECTLSSRHHDVVRRSVEKMVSQKLLQWRDGKLRLTKKGEKELKRLTLTENIKQRPAKWDGKWRVLIFDIAEKRRNLRIRLRRTLQRLGFERLQDSVWVYPYDCEDLIALLKADFRVGDDVLYMIVDLIEHDDELRRHFALT